MKTVGVRPSFSIILLILLSQFFWSCSLEKKRLQKAISQVEANRQAPISPYQDPAYREKVREELRDFIDKNSFREIIQLSERLDSIGRDLLLQQLEPEKAKIVKNAGKARGAESYPETLMTVYFGTNRQLVRAEEPSAVFNNARNSRKLHVGQCQVNIPPIHALGEIEKPSFFQLEFSTDPARHMFIKKLSVQQEQTFESKLAGLGKKEAFVFIHGYNTSFEDAALRTAQIAYDLKYPGVPIFYSWPSAGALEAYFNDEEVIEKSDEYLFKFLELVLESGSFERVNVIAHSMGNRATLEAMVQFSKKYDRPVFNHLVLAAPDVDAGIFMKDIAPFLDKAAKNVTLYASSNDIALTVSKTIHTRPRLGQGGDNLFISQGIESIDASVISSDLFGHGYFYNSWILVEDVYKLVVKDLQADKRGLQSLPKGTLKYWFLKDN